MPTQLSALPIGSLIKDTATMYYGSPIIWRVVDKNHSGYPANSVTLITDKIISIKGVDGAESGRTDYGNNRYIYSNLRQWLNSTGSANSWYVAQHSADTPPTTVNMRDYNGYDIEKGFLANFSSDFRSKLMSTSLTVAKNIEIGGNSEITVDKIFLASRTEMGLGYENSIIEGTILSHFSDNSSRVAYPTTQTASNCTSNTTISPSSAYSWWLRTPDTSMQVGVYYVSTSGTLQSTRACYGITGLRPLCNLPSATTVSDTADSSDGAYSISWSGSGGGDGGGGDNSGSSSKQITDLMKLTSPTGTLNLYSYDGDLYLEKKLTSGNSVTRINTTPIPVTSSTKPYCIYIRQSNNIMDLIAEAT